jgi:peptide/nickel transport system substrate-binding protein
LKDRRFGVVALALVAVAGAAWYTYLYRTTPPGSPVGPQAGGRLVATFHTEPRSFNRLVSPQAAESLQSLLTQSTLVRVNRVTGVLEPRLARAWSTSSDGRAWTLNLREGVTFSDGVPLTSADVLFTFQALYDKRVGSPMASGFQVNGQPLSARAVDDHTVVVTFPAPFGPGLSILDSLPILPRHKLHDSLEAGTFRQAWGVTTPPADIVGLGPFVLTEYVPGQRLRFGRNTRYWRRDDRGQPLPYLDELEVQVVPEQTAEVLRLEAGDVDLINDQVRPEDLAALRKLSRAGGVRLVDAGVGLDPDALWFNLAPGAPSAKDRPWLQSETLRRAISYAVDRQAIVNTVYLGAGEPIHGSVTSGFGDWFLPDLPRTEHDLARAKQLLGSIGLVDRRGDGTLQDPSGRPARFSILTQKGSTIREQTAAVLQEQLRQVGLTVDVAAVDQGALFGRFSKGAYDAMFYGVVTDSTDPARNLDFWMSSGSFHFWNPEQVKPATDWEAKIDDLMRKQSTSLDPAERRSLFADVQRIMADHLPILYFAAPRVTVAMSGRIQGATPSVLRPPVLWNSEVLSVDASGRAPRR